MPMQSKFRQDSPKSANYLTETAVSLTLNSKSEWAGKTYKSWVAIDFSQ